MEAPAKSVTSTVTMIAPKHAVMIDDPAWPITHLVDPGSEAFAHPSQRARAERGQGSGTEAMPADRPALEKGPVTCSTCRMTYLPSAVPPASTPAEDWVCDGCRATLG